jgi:hypothetical protein
MLDLLVTQLLPSVLQALGGGSEQSAAPDPAGEIESAIPPHNGRGNVIDNVLSTLFGRPDMVLQSDELRERNGRRADAAQLARNAFQSPGEGFMDPPSVGGSGFGLHDIGRIFRRIT